MIMDRLIDNIFNMQNPSALGLDTRIEYFPEDFASQYDLNTLDGAAEGIIEFNKRIIDATHDIVPCVKVQVAYYEMYGLPGMAAFYQTIAYAKKMGMMVIADVKRNDIGSTAAAYSSAYIGKTSLKSAKTRAYEADFATVNPYLGTDGIKPFTKDCKDYDKGIFVMVKTSNPSGVEFQNLSVGDCTLFERVGDYVSDWGKELVGDYGYSSVGAVVGATYPEEGAMLRKRMNTVFFLLPGYGAQGANASDLAGNFDEKGIGAIVNASRSLQCAWKKMPDETGFAMATRKAALLMKDDICGALNANGKGEWK